MSTITKYIAVRSGINDTRLAMTHFNDGLSYLTNHFEDATQFCSIAAAQRAIDAYNLRRTDIAKLFTGNTLSIEPIEVIAEAAE